MKKALTLCLALCMLLGIYVPSVSAAETTPITPSNGVEITASVAYDLREDYIPCESDAEADDTPMLGDMNGDGMITAADINLLIYLFKNGKIPCDDYGHNYKKVVVSPTCEEAGLETSICTTCGDNFSVELPALGHTEVITPAVPATCTQMGLTEGKHCSVCDEVLVAQEVIPALGHSYEAVFTTPTAKEDGYTTYTCACSDTYTEAVVPVSFTVTSSNRAEIGYTGVTGENLVIPAVFEKDGVWYRVTSIGYEAFYYCDSLESIVIPDSVTSIGNSAFGGCASLTHIIIPESVTSIGSFAFYYCGNLEKILVKVGNPNYHSDGNCLIETASKTLVVGCKTSVIPTNSSVTSIGELAFAHCSNLTSIVIPDSVTSIGNSAFFNCKSLTSVTFGENSKLESIVDSAFANCYSLTSIVIPDSVTSIGSYAFYYCYKLVEVINKSSLSIYSGSSDNGYIAYYAMEVHTGESKIVNQNDYLFYTYNGVNYLLGYVGADTSLTLPASYNGQRYKINNYAFYECKNLTSVTISNSVTSIGSCAFQGCSKLVEVINKSSLSFTKGSSSNGYVAYYAMEVHTGESKIVNQNGYLFYTCRDVIYPYSEIKNYLFGYVGVDTELMLPENYNGQSYEIYERAFYGCDSLTSIVIPESVTSIGEYAFADCDRLTNITINGCVTSIGNRAFYSTKYYNTTSNWDNNVLYIGKHLIEAETTIAGTYTVKNDTICIVDGAFRKCTKLTSIVIPESVTSIGSYAFQNCTSLTSIIIPDGVESIGDQAFHNCESLASVTFGENSQLTNIGDSAFKYCPSLTRILIPDSVTSIGECAFEECYSLASVLFGKDSRLESIGYYAFDVCIKLTSITIPDNVTSIGNSVFEYCTSLTSITIPDSVTSIGNSVFEYCTSLTSITIPDSVTSIGDDAFLNTKYYNTTSNWDNGVLYIGKHLIDAKTTLSGTYTIKDGTLTVGISAFEDCTSLTSITIPDSVISIGYNAFSNTGYYNDASNWENGVLYIGKYLIDVNTSLSGAYQIKEGTICIGDYAFAYCPSLTSITIPASVTSIGKYAFVGCYKLVEVINKSSLAIAVGSTTVGSVTYYAKEVHAGESKIVNQNGYLFYTYNGVNYLIGFVGADTSLTLPASYNGQKYEIYENAFYNCDDLTSVTIGSGVTSVGESAFSGCTSLTSIEIPDSVTSIGEWAFYNCSKLTSIVIPDSVTSIGDYAFSDCTNLQTVTMPAFAIPYIPQNKLETVVITSGASISSSAFKDCTSLTKVTIGNGVTSIGAYAFYGCTSLTSIVIPDTVTSIGSYVFEDCYNLTSIEIPDGVTTIGYGAFHSCSGLKSVVFKDTSTWYCTDNYSNWKNMTGGTETSVTNASTNAKYFKSWYYDYYWYKL